MATVQRRNNTYKITVSCGYDTLGRQIRHSMTWIPEHDMTEKQIAKELERQKVLFEEKCKNGQYVNNNIKFADFVQLWRKNYGEKQLAPKTLKTYDDLLKRINTAIGHIPINKLQPHHLLSFYNNLAEQGIADNSKCRLKKEHIKILSDVKTGTLKKCGISATTARALRDCNNVSVQVAKKVCDGLGLDMDIFELTGNARTLSARYIGNHHRTISAILGVAVQWQLIQFNPCERIKPPKVERKETVCFDEEQATVLIRKLNNAPIQFRTMIIMLIYTGMRLGELCGLEWKDIDFERGLITVRRASQYLPGKGVFTKETKNKSSERTNKYAGELFLLLREFERWQIEQRLKYGDKWENHDRLFTQWNGAPIHPSSLTAWFTKFLAAEGLPHVTIHSLRHTNASLMIASGVDIRTVSKRLGHAQTSTTMNIYAHAIRSADEAAAEVIHLPIQSLTVNM